MAASVSGSKTVSVSVAPHISAATMTTLMSTPIENLTVAQFTLIAEALGKIASGREPTKTLGQLFG